MFESNAKKKIKEFVNHIELLARGATDRLVFGFRGEETEKEFLKQIIADTWALIENNEWGVALDNLIDNLREIDFRIDEKAVTLAKESIEASGWSFDDWRFIEDLKK